MQVYLLDMHHSIGILEMMRVLIDLHYLTFQQAFLITQKCFSLQSHGTVEELSMRWNLDIFKKVLPRHFELILMIDHFFVRHLRTLDKIKSNPKMVERLRITGYD